MRKFTGLKLVPKSIWAIGIAGFLINIATSLVFGLSTGFMRCYLGFSVGSTGKIQSLVESLSYIVKFTSGIFSDVLRRRKLLMLFGFGLIVISKPIMAFSSTVFFVFLARAIDRIGNGIQSTPRDALIGDLASKESRGQSFGLRQTLTYIGSSLGALLSIYMMIWTNSNYKFIFMLAGIPCLIAIIFLTFFVPDPIADEKKVSFRGKLSIMRQEVKILEKHYWKLILVVFVFMLCRYGEAPLVLTALEKLHLPENYAATVNICYNVVTSLTAYPIGVLSDRVGRERILMLGICCAIIANLILAHANSLCWLYLGVAFWGAQIAITMTIFTALITDYSSIHLRGTALSIYYFVSFLAVLIAGHIYEFCVESFSLSAPFMVGAVFSFISLLLTLVFLRPTEKIESH
ncbi:MAG: MFS transporter [Alphaproteobacteria bacterium]|nr:MAG: MFS transporter [Alphaproteobacteria bacterium]